MKFHHVLLAGCLFAGCSETNRSKTDQLTASDSTSQAPVVKPLYANRAVHPFSSADKPDTFQIAIRGESIITGQVYFQITNPAGQRIYAVDFPATYLLDYGFSESITPQKEEQYIKQRIDAYFKPANFSQPAIPAGNSFEADYSDKSIWQAIKADPSAIGFSYLIGKEDGRQIAYSKTLKKVVLYYNCC